MWRCCGSGKTCVPPSLARETAPGEAATEAAPAEKAPRLGRDAPEAREDAEEVAGRRLGLRACGGSQTGR
jgi:hypothetical protein